MIEWLFSPKWSPTVGGVSLLITAAGFVITVWGLRLTFLQAKKAQTAAAAASSAVSAFRTRVRQHGAAQDISEALYAVDTTKRHLSNDAWKDASDSYEDAWRALIRFQTERQCAAEIIDESMQGVLDHMIAFCSQVDGAVVGKGRLPDKVKVLAAIRQNYRVLVEARSQIIRETEYDDHSGQV